MSSDSWGLSDFEDKIRLSPPRLAMPTPQFNAASLTYADITDQRLRQAYQKIAEIISQQGERGEAYLPIFTRLHEELQTREANKSLLALANEVAGEVPEP